MIRGFLKLLAILFLFFFVKNLFFDQPAVTSKPAQPATVASTVYRPPVDAVKNSPWDASVWQVERFLKKQLKDPDSYEGISWSKVMKLSDGTYRVRHTYRAKNSFGGYGVENTKFVLDKSGNVTSFSRE